MGRSACLEAVERILSPLKRLGVELRGSHYRQGVLTG